MNTQLSHAETQMDQPAQPEQLPTANPMRYGKVIAVLSTCMALQMTSFVMILPLFARRFSEFGAGVESLGISAMAYALAATLSAPFMGALADRFGRRLVVLTSLVVYALAFTGYLFASSASTFILLRAMAGAFTAGLIPAVIGIVADIAPTDRRAQWIGFVNGGASIGWIVGPILGGLLYDQWGYRAAFSASIVMATATFIMALLTLPETRKNLDHTQTTRAFSPRQPKASTMDFRSTLPSSLFTFVVLLCISFVVMFAWAFIEPKFMYYAYDDLKWSSSMLGLVMSTYGIAMTLGEFGLSRLSDRIGRKPVIVVGLLLFMAQFVGLAFFRNYILIAVSFVIAGFGNALYDPALTASTLDIAPAEHQARILGIKSTVASLGNILGPGLVVLFTPFLEAQGVFIVAIGVVCVSVLFFLSVRIKPHSNENHGLHIEDKNEVTV